jgi:hypothetical protein
LIPGSACVEVTHGDCDVMDYRHWCLTLELG